MALHISIPHKDSQTEAIKKIKKVAAELKVDHGDEMSNLKEEWKGNTCEVSFNVRGYTISGTLVVMSHSYELTGELPWALHLFKGKIEKMIKNRAIELLRKAK